MTDAHNSNLVDDDKVIGTVRNYDLLFFRTERTATVEAAAPQAGEDVIAYGQGTHGLRQAAGKVKTFWPAAFGFVSDAGPGFSGGPVIDAHTGALLGITYGFIDQSGERLMLAYTMAFVMKKWAEIHAQAGAQESVTEPAAKAGEPAAKAGEPAASAGEAAANASNPAANASEPASNTGKPAAGTSSPATSASEPAADFLTPAIARAYLPLKGKAYFFLDAYGAAVVIAPGVAVTDAHNASLVDDDKVIGIVKRYDLLFFRTEQTATVETAAPQMGEDAIAYGQGTHGLRRADGRVQTLGAGAFGVISNGGPGFSGGPVIDAHTGALLGITHGFSDQGGQRLILAYTMAFVAKQWDEVHTATEGP